MQESKNSSKASRTHKAKPGSFRSGRKKTEKTMSDHKSVTWPQQPPALERLDLNTFKVHPCPNESQHNYKRCFYYHTDLDRRRDPNQFSYDSEFCMSMRESEQCSRGDLCSFSHTKVEQAYHHKKYRKKFCIHYPHRLQECPYSKYCSYAHSEEEIGVTMLHNYTKDADFFLFHFKTQFCPYSKCADRSKCIYAHNWQDFRRDPSKFSYRPNSCNNWDPKLKVSNYDSACHNSIDCHHCHGRVR